MKNMSSSFVRSKVFALALGVLFALPILAHAEGYKGKFTLPNETHWGSVVLAPGDYDFVLDSASAPTKVVVRSADGKVAAMLVSMWSSETNVVKSNSLQLETRGSQLFVSAVYMKDMGVELHFALPRMKESGLAHEATKTPSTGMTASAQ